MLLRHCTSTTLWQTSPTSLQIYWRELHSFKNQEQSPLHSTTANYLMPVIQCWSTMPEHRSTPNHYAPPKPVIPEMPLSPTYLDFHWCKYQWKICNIMNSLNLRQHSDWWTNKEPTFLDHITSSKSVSNILKDNVRDIGCVFELAWHVLAHTPDKYVIPSSHLMWSIYFL